MESTTRTYSAAEVSTHVATLKALLADVGPAVSASLTQLVLLKPHATREEALRFISEQLVKVSRTWWWTCDMPYQP